jgi:hypothetical protein
VKRKNQQHEIAYPAISGCSFFARVQRVPVPIRVTGSG